MPTRIVSAALGLLALLGIRSHHSAVVLLVALLPTYLIRFTVFGVPTTLLEAGVVIVAIMGIAQASIRQQWRAAWRAAPFPALLLALVFGGTCVIGAMISAEQRASLGILKGWVITPMTLGWMVYAASSHQQKMIAKIITAAVLSGTVVASIGLVQIGQIPRSTSIYDTPASLALYITPLFVLAVWQATQNQKRGMGIIVLILAAGLIATQSFAAILASTAAIGVGVWLTRAPDKRKKLGAIIIGSLVVATTTFIYSGRMAYLQHAIAQPNEASSISVRLQLWSIGWELIKERPILGIGLGQFEQAYQKKLHERFKEYEQNPTNQQKPLPEFVFRDPHNWLLSFWLNAGVVGLLSFGGLNAVTIYRGLQKQKNTTAEAQALALALLALMIYGAVDTIYWKNDLASLHWILIGTLVASAVAAPKKEEGFTEE